MLKINLLPIRQLQKRDKARNQIILVLFGFFCLLLALAGTAYLQTLKVSTLETSIANLEAEKNTYSETLAKIKTLEKEKKELARKSAVIDKLKQDSSLTVRVLDEVSNIIDNTRMWLLSLNQQGGSLQLSGVALDNQTIAQFMDNLKESPFVQQVDLTDSSLKKISGRDLKSFSLTCAVSQPGSVQPDPAQTK